MIKTICIAGKNEIAIHAVQYLLDFLPEHKIVFIPNGDDTGMDSWQPSFKSFCKKQGVDEVQLDDIYEVNNLVFFSLEFDKIIKVQNFLSSELFNIHFSLLPKYKGVYTSSLPLLHGEKISGVTLHKIDSGIDTGPIVSQLRIHLTKDMNAGQLYKSYLSKAKALFESKIESIINQNYEAVEQSSANSTYFSRKSIDFSDKELNLAKTANQVKNQVRSFAFREFQLPTFSGSEITRSEITSSRSTFPPGTILSETIDTFIVSTVDFDIILKKDLQTNLFHEIKQSNFPQVSKIVPHLESIDIRSKEGWSASMVASFFGNYEILNFLLDKGADINITNFKGTSLLMYAFSAVERGLSKRPFQLLLSKNANVHHRDKQGNSLEDYARLRGTELILSNLLERQ